MNAPLKGSMNAYIYTQTSCFAGLQNQSIKKSLKIVNLSFLGNKVRLDLYDHMQYIALFFDFIASKYTELCLLFIEFDRLMGVFLLKYIVSEYIVALKC